MAMGENSTGRLAEMCSWDSVKGLVEQHHRAVKKKDFLYLVVSELPYKTVFLRQEHILSCFYSHSLDNPSFRSASKNISGKQSAFS